GIERGGERGPRPIARLGDGAKELPQIHLGHAKHSIRSAAATRNLSPLLRFLGPARLRHASSRACSGTGFAPTRTMRILALAFAIAALGCNEHGSTPCTGQNCCHTSADCKQTFEQCFEPGADIGCGACQIPPTTCQVDTECATQGPTAICSVARCT